MTCSKIRYRHKLDAKIAMSKAQHKDGSRRYATEKRAYWCRQCKAWHLTSKERWTP